MQQSLLYDLRETLRAVEQAGFFEHATCTILARLNDPSDPAVNAMGQADLATLSAVSGLSNIACMIAPRRSDPDQRGVERREEEFRTREERRVLLDGYYPQIEQRYVADITMVDSAQTTRYEIMAVESPSQETFTTLAVRRFAY